MRDMSYNIPYMTHINNKETTIRFTDDEQRKVFQLKMALNVLESEVINTMGIDSTEDQ